MSRITGVLLAAGHGTRFDQTGQSDKLLALLPDGRRVIEAAAANLRAGLDPTDDLLVVVAPDHLGYPLPSGAQLLVNPYHRRGVGTSIARAIEATPHASGWLIALADMPYIQSATIRSVRDALAIMDALGTYAPGIVAPAHRGQRGHPVGFAGRHREELAALDGDTGARALLEQYPVHLIATDDSGILRDIDTPADLTDA